MSHKFKFFDRLDWAAFWTATVLTMVVYYFTLGPSVGLEDSGELATAAANLGVPHPPGYPFWTFCSWLFCKAFSFVTYMGHPTPAWCVSLCSAVFGAFAAGFTAMLICRSGRDFIGSGFSGLKFESTDGQLTPTDFQYSISSRQSTSANCLAFGGAVAGALTFALSPVEWSQSTIVEIYSLNAFFLMWVFLLSYRWMRRPSDKILWITAFVFGLGLTNYQVLLFAIVPLTIIIAVRKIRLFRDVFIYMAPILMTWQLLQIGQLYRAHAGMSSDAINKFAPIVDKTVACPPGWGVALALTLLIGSLAAAAFLRARALAKADPLAGGADSSAARERREAGLALARRTLAYGGGAAVALLCFFTLCFRTHVCWPAELAEIAPLIAPVRYALIAVAVVASVFCAALASFWTDDDYDSRRIYRRLVLGAAVAAAVAVFLAVSITGADGAGYEGQPYPWTRSTLIFLALMALLIGLCATVKRGYLFAIPVAGLHLAAFILLYKGALNGLTHPASWWFIWPIAWNFILLAMTWLLLPNGRSVAGAAFFCQLGVSFYVYMPIVSDFRNPPMNWGYPRTWDGFKHAIMRGQYEAIGFQLPTWAGINSYFKDVLLQFTDVLVPFALVPFIAGDLAVRSSRRRFFWNWMIAALSCFLLMSVLLIGLASVKGDIQDGFIQKVKFISSHAMIALWIGYGIVFAGALLLKFLVGRRLVKPTDSRIPLGYAALALAIALVFPIVDNYTNDQLVFELGGAEQNDHTFGWQFGAYQLDGAKAIKAQLSADEEPLPDPDYPPAMDAAAVFFGGTDPGRFVPTYMIYSAKFRPDVYLITQNALADDTYMSVERDLYGDEIWIPSKDDCSDAFSEYVTSLTPEERLAKGVVTENGRVQVTGALSVMDINAILTHKMFTHEKTRHSFYIEESYPIPWMYPYLSPHGLIMKIDRERHGCDPVRATKDADFWDWYTRRLLADPMFRRDFAAQKSFSKLRAAIAGLYARQGRPDYAAQAFREACAIYPASPESTFRYVQEILLPRQLEAVALELMNYTDLIDPNNRRTANVRDYLVRARDLRETTHALEAKRRSAAGLTAQEAYDLAVCYHAAGRFSEAAELVLPLAERAGDAASQLNLARLLTELRKYEAAEKCFARYLRQKPSDMSGWVALSKVQLRLGKIAAAVSSFECAISADARTLQKLIPNDPELMQVYTRYYELRMKDQQNLKPNDKPYNRSRSKL